MVRGRKIGQIEVTMNEIETIIELTKCNCTRPEIARCVCRSQNTVYRYQKKYMDKI